MANKVLSIYVGSDAIRVAEMQTSNKTVILTNAAEISTPDNSVNDGYLVDISAIAEAIRTSIFGRGFSSKDVIFTVTSKKIASKEVDIPYVKQEKKLQSILMANSGEYFPMSNTGDYAFAYSILENYMTDEGRKCRVSAVAAPNDLLKCYYELADELKFNVKSIDYFGNSVIQLLQMQMTEGRTDLVLQIEKDVTYVNVMRGKVLVLQRSVPYGKNAVINALMDVKKISEKDAKTLLSNETLLDQHVTEDEYAEAVQYLVSGIGRVVEYHRNKNASDLLQGIKVFGEGSAIAGIEKILERELGAPVQHFETLAGVQIKGQASLTAEEVLRYLPNIGAVINPVDLAVTRGGDNFSVDSAQIIKVLSVVLGLAFVVMAVLTTISIIQNVQAQNRNDELNSDIAAIADIEAIAQEHDAAMKVYYTLNLMDLSTESDTELVLDLIYDMEKKLPKDSYISELTVDNGECSFKVTSGLHTYVKNELADIIVTFGRETDYIEDLLVEGYEETIYNALVTGVNPETNELEYLREDPDEDNPEGALVNVDHDYVKEHPEIDLTKVVQLVQSDFTVSCTLVDHYKAVEKSTAQGLLDGTIKMTSDGTMEITMDATSEEGGAE